MTAAKPGHFAFSGPDLDRSALQREDGDLWRALDHPDTRILPVCGALNLFDRSEGLAPVLLSGTALQHRAFETKRLMFLGQHDQRRYFALRVRQREADQWQSNGREFDDLKRHLTALSDLDARLCCQARALNHWHRNHQHCGRCGAQTYTGSAGHSRYCSNQACGTQQFPRTDPAIIVAVSRDDALLLGRQASWDQGQFSVLAGFVEAGESLEDAVRREIHEESGIQVDKIRYYGSQPWPFPASLMLGFEARARNREIRLNDQELEQAHWFSRPQIIDGLRAGTLKIPPSASISWALIRDWFNQADGADLESLIKSLER